MYTFRTAGSEDFEAASAFPQNAQECYYMSPVATFPLTGEQLAKIAETRYLPTVVLEGDRVVGYAVFYGLEPGQHVYLGNFVVDPGYRGKGAAKALIGEMLRQAEAELHVPVMKLSCHNINLPGLLFYQKLGFVPFDMRPAVNHDGTRIMTITMELPSSTKFEN